MCSSFYAVRTAAHKHAQAAQRGYRLVSLVNVASESKDPEIWVSESHLKQHSQLKSDLQPPSTNVTPSRCQSPGPLRVSLCLSQPLFISIYLLSIYLIYLSRSISISPFRTHTRLFFVSSFIIHNTSNTNTTNTTTATTTSTTTATTTITTTTNTTAAHKQKPYSVGTAGSAQSGCQSCPSTPTLE